MTQISIKDAAEQLDQLVRLALQGEEIILTEGDKPTARIVCMPSHTIIGTRKRRHAGSATGTLSLTSDFDAPLEDFAEYI